jgi:hypothetical protein
MPLKASLGSEPVDKKRKTVDKPTFFVEKCGLLKNVCKLNRA